MNIKSVQFFSENNFTSQDTNPKSICSEKKLNYSSLINLSYI